MRVSLVSTYPEGALRHIAHGFEEHGTLSQVVLPSRKIVRWASRALPANGAALRAARATRSIPRRVEIRADIEVRRLMAGIARRPFDHLAAARSFAESASRRIDHRTDTLVALPMCGLESFVSHRDSLRVVHQVNTPAPVHNERLLHFYDKTEVQSELHETEYIDRYFQEMAACDVVLSPATRVTTQLAQSGVHDVRVVQLAYGVDLGRFGEVPGGRRVEPRSNGRPRVIYAGQISRRKGIPFLLEAAARSRVDLTLIGPIVEGKLITDLPPNITYRGVMSHGELAREYNAHDAFVYPTLEDNFALGLLEAAASGLPILTTPVAGAVEVLSILDSVSVVEPGNSRVLGEAMQAFDFLSEDERQYNSGLFRGLVAKSDLNTWEQYSHDVVAAIAAIER